MIVTWYYTNLQLKCLKISDQSDSKVDYFSKILKILTLILTVNVMAFIQNAYK